jgi:ketosteroid isomerase-like protein
MPSSAEHTAFEHAHIRWAASDLEGFLDLLTEDVLYTVNVDGLAVPYASSALGKEDVRQRLQLLLDTFTVDKFEPESIVPEGDHWRSVVIGHYTHRTTGEVLKVRVRFRVWFRGGLISRFDEHHDAAYVEAFQRFVFHLQNAVRDNGN